MERRLRWNQSVAATLGMLWGMAGSSVLGADAPDFAERLAALRGELLARHSFERTSNDPGDLELMVGNGELGGLVRRDGLGLDLLWAADLWENESNRIPLPGIRVSWEAMDLNESALNR